VLNLPLVGLWVRLLYIPKPQLYAGILVFAMIGIWGVSGSVFDLAMMAVLGVVSYTMRVYGFPIAPLLIGLILVPLTENQLRTALAAGQGNVGVLFHSPIAVSFFVAAVLFLFVPWVLKKLK